MQDTSFQQPITLATNPNGPVRPAPNPNGQPEGTPQQGANRRREVAEGPEYTTFPRTFPRDRWFKPLLVILVYLLLSTMMNPLTLLAWISAGWDSGALVPAYSSGEFGIFELTVQNVIGFFLIPALNLIAFIMAVAIVGERPLSSYSSSRGGLNWKTLVKCVLFALLFYSLYQLGTTAVLTFVTKPGMTAADVLEQFAPPAMTVGTALAALVLLPLQCASEEYVFRGWMMQAIGSWTKVPIVALIVSSLIFGIIHMQYNVAGIVGVIGGALLMGLVAWKTKGLEGPLAMHIANNVMALWVMGLGDYTTNEIGWDATIIAFVGELAFAILLMLIGRSRGWFVNHTATPVPHGFDGTTPMPSGQVSPASQTPTKQPMSVPRKVAIAFGIAICALGLTQVLYLNLNGGIQFLGSSMEPTLIHGDMMSTAPSDTISVGDIVIYQQLSDEHGEDGEEYYEMYVSRVVAMDAGTVEIRNGVLYANGERSPWQTAKSEGNSDIDGKWDLHDGEVFVFGDNWSASQTTSEDERQAITYEDNVISKNDITMRVTGILEPFSRVTSFD